METTYWKDDFEGEAHGGYFVRNDLFKFFETLRKAGKEPVGIKIDDSWNLEVIISDNPSKD